MIAINVQIFWRSALLAGFTVFNSSHSGKQIAAVAIKTER